MPAERTTMRQVREVLRLRFVGGVSTGEIARRIGVAASTVRATVKRFQAAGLSWPPDMRRYLAQVRLEKTHHGAARVRRLSASTSIAGILPQCRELPHRASSELPHCSKWHPHWVTSVARTRNDSGIMRPSALAILR